MAIPVSITKVVYSGLSLVVSSTLNINYALAFGVPDFATLNVVEEGVGTPVPFIQLSTGILQITQDGTVPASGTFVLTLDVPTDSFVRSILDGNIFREETLKDLFTQALIISGSVAEGRLSALEEDLDVNGNRLLNVGDSTVTTDGINRGELDAEVALLNTDISGIVAGMIPDGDYGDVSVSGAGTVWTLDPDAVDQVVIADGAVVTAKIADLNVTASKLSTNSVTTAKLNTDSVTTTKVLDANITTAKLAPNAVTLAKLAQVGTAGQVLTSNGGSTDASYEDAGGGAWELVQTQTMAGSPSSIDFTTGFDGDYIHTFDFEDLQTNSGTNAVMELLFSTDNGSSFDTGNNYNFQNWNIGTTGGGGGSWNEAHNSIDLTRAGGEEGFQGFITMRGMNNAAGWTTSDGVLRLDGDGGYAGGMGVTYHSGNHRTPEVHDAVRFILSAGTLAKGKISHYRKAL